MPIYAYRCESCGHAKDVLQKMSDEPLSQCPACGASAFKKQLTAAGFQLKGSGWYVTDFRDGGKASKSPDKSADEGGGGSVEKADGKPGEKTADKSPEAGATAKPADSSAAAASPPSGAPAPSAPAPSAAPSVGASS